jgi:hypothetical protein
MIFVDFLLSGAYKSINVHFAAMKLYLILQHYFFFGSRFFRRKRRPTFNFLFQLINLVELRRNGSLFLWIKIS